jgi:broad specificity phosphatase PhoE
MTLWLVRHGETEWSLSGRHTSFTDLPLTSDGELQAVAIGKLLAGRPFDHVLSSPLQRAADTAKLAGFGNEVQISDALREVDYGGYEGLTTPQIWERAPGWQLFRDGSPGGESPSQIRERVDGFLADVDSMGTNVLLFGHGHCFRAIAARYLGLPISAATALRLDAGSVSILAPERDGPSVLLWNRRVPPRAVLVADMAIRVPHVRS